jgi:hypothetical protein
MGNFFDPDRVYWDEETQINEKDWWLEKAVDWGIGINIAVLAALNI